MPQDGMSFYSEDFYGLGYFSYEELPGLSANVNVRFYSTASLTQIVAVSFSADANIKFYATSSLGVAVTHSLTADAYFPFYAYAPELGLIHSLSSNNEAYIQFYPSAILSLVKTFQSSRYFTLYIDSDEYIGPFWAPDVPAGGDFWVPDVPVPGPWVAVSPTHGPWIPIGPDTQPNPGYLDG